MVFTRARLQQAWKLLRRHPRRLLRNLWVKVHRRFRGPPVPSLRVVNGLHFERDPRYGEEIMYGILEYDVVDAMKHFLQPGDVCVDVGANIGYLSAVAAGCVGPSGEVHAFEPVRRHFEQLTKLPALNPMYTFHLHQCALSDRDERNAITVARFPHMGASTFIPSLLPFDLRETQETVTVRRLDTYLRERRLEDVALIKIDVEGYEFLVLRGLEHYFARARRQPVIVCEIQPRAYTALGLSLADLAAYMSRWGYAAFDIDGAKTPVGITACTDVTNVVFLPQRVRPDQ